MAAGDYGTAPASYTPDVIYSGMIGKIAKQVIEGTTIRSKFAGLFKEPMRFGKDLEAALIKAATGKDYTPTGDVTAADPSADVLIFKNSKKRTYSVKIDYNRINEIAVDGERAQREAEMIVQSLYSGAFADENTYILSAFSGATAGTPSSAGTVQIVSGSNYTIPTDTASAQKLLQAIKDYAKYIRQGDTSVNPRANSCIADTVCMIIPAKVMTAIDVYGRLDFNNNEYSRFDVDEVYEYIPASGGDDSIYIFDTKYAQFCKLHEDSYKEADKAGNDNVDAFLHTYRQYAACPLFSAVKLEQGTGGSN